jgi:benzaldehyde dehydrogenase (NAD)
MGLLDDESVWRGKIFTGEWTSTGKTTPSTEPATGHVLAEVGTASAEVLSRSARQAADAGRRWAATAFPERAAVLRRAAALFEEHRDEITGWLTREAGKAAPAAKLDFDLALSELQDSGPVRRPGRVRR